MSARRIFDEQHYDRLNQARGEVVTSFLSEAAITLGLRSAIDVGCGLGHFSGVLKSLGFSTQAVDGRQENVDEAKRRFPEIAFSKCDAQDRTMLDFGLFDLVFCFGLLYHLENPLAAIRNLYSMTGKVLFIEAVTYPGDEPIMALIDETEFDDQGLSHLAFYPTETCLVKMLYRAGFSNVYGFQSQPNHPEYRPTTGLRRTRTILAASNAPIPCRGLIRLTEISAPVAPWNPASGVPKPLSLQRLRRFVCRSL